MVFMNAENMVKKSEQMLITSIFFFYPQALLNNKTDEGFKPNVATF
jgi:hypothetical protein